MLSLKKMMIISIGLASVSCTAGGKTKESSSGEGSRPSTVSTDKGNTMKKNSWKEFTPIAKEEIKKRLSPVQFEVTQEEGTERPFSNEYWDNKKRGIYVDVLSGEPLFSSKDKYDSGTGWPSFSQPIGGVKLKEKVDRRLFSERTEVRSPLADSHLGHVFPDGPAPTGLRYCMNSASLRFVPEEKMDEEGYSEFKKYL